MIFIVMDIWERGITNEAMYTNNPLSLSQPFKIITRLFNRTWEGLGMHRKRLICRSRGEPHLEKEKGNSLYGTRHEKVMYTSVQKQKIFFLIRFFHRCTVHTLDSPVYRFPQMGFEHFSMDRLFLYAVPC